MGSTIFDVAKQAGVSIGTVSRVVNNRDRVSPQTRDRVLEAIRALDYHPNSFAQGLAGQQTETIGLVIPQVNDSFYYEIVRGVEDTVTAADYSLLIVSQPRQSPDNHYGKLFRRGFVDAMILTAIAVYPDEIKKIIAGGVPVVFIKQNPGKDVPAVLADNYGGMCELTEHLVGHGYRRFAYITGTSHTPDNKERLRAIQDTLEKHGLTLPSENVVQGNYLRGSGYTAMKKLLDLPQRPEAVIAGNDQMATDAIIAAQHSGLSVPEDIAVTGFDDVPLASYLSPALTTVRQPVYDIGVEAARLAFSLLESQSKGRNSLPPRVILPTTLVIRRSCGCDR